MSTDVGNKCTATYPCLCEEPSQIASTGYHQWIQKYNCPELGSKWESVKNADTCAKLYLVSDITDGTMIKKLDIASGTMSSVFDTDKPVTNCFDGVLTATGNYVCKTQGSAKSWAQFVLKKQVDSSYPDRSSANYRYKRPNNSQTLVVSRNVGRLV